MGGGLKGDCSKETGLLKEKNTENCNVAEWNTSM